MWTAEHTETTTATSTQLWARYADPTTWPEWDDTVTAVTVDGPMAAGTRARIRPAGGPAVRLRFTEVEPGVRFTTVTRLPLARLAFAHVVEPGAGGGCRFTHRVTLTGLLSPLFARLVGRRAAADLPAAMRKLARLAETPAEPDGTAPRSAPAESAGP